MFDIVVIHSDGTKVTKRNVMVSNVPTKVEAEKIADDFRTVWFNEEVYFHAPKLIVTPANKDEG